MGQLQHLIRAVNAAHKAASEVEIWLLAPSAKNQLIARGVDTINLTKKEIIAVLEDYYGKKDMDKKNNPIFDDILKEKIAWNEYALHAVYW